MKNETNITHKRFYIYRHQMDGEVQTIQYFTQGGWVDDFEYAWLRSDLNVVQQDATGYTKGGPWTYCVGAVDCVVDGFFVPIVV